MLRNKEVQNLFDGYYFDRGDMENNKNKRGGIGMMGTTGNFYNVANIV